MPYAKRWWQPGQFILQVAARRLPQLLGRTRWHGFTVVDLIRGDGLLSHDAKPCLVPLNAPSVQFGEPLGQRRRRDRGHVRALKLDLPGDPAVLIKLDGEPDAFFVPKPPHPPHDLILPARRPSASMAPCMT